MCLIWGTSLAVSLVPTYLPGTLTTKLKVMWSEPGSKKFPRQHFVRIVAKLPLCALLRRFCRLRQYNTLYICGTDEYGTATETKVNGKDVAIEVHCMSIRLEKILCVKKWRDFFHSVKVANLGSFFFSRDI